MPSDDNSSHKIIMIKLTRVEYINSEGHYRIISNSQADHIFQIRWEPCEAKYY